MDAICFETSRTAPSPLSQPPPVGKSYDVCGALRALWAGLLNRRFVVLEWSATHDAVSLSLRRAQPALPTTARYRAAQIFDTVARGEQQKVVAIERGLSASSIAGTLRQVMLGMELTGNFSRLPLAIPLLAHAGRRPSLVESYFEGSGVAPYVVRLKRPDSVFHAYLSRCELEVAHLFLEGHSYEQIAKARDTSVRTIANQMSSTFRKLGVSGRFGLLKKAVQIFAPQASLLPEAPQALEGAEPSPSSGCVVREPAAWSLVASDLRLTGALSATLQRSL